MYVQSITSSDGLFGLCKGLLAASVLQSDAAEAQQSIFMSLSPEYQAAMQGMLEDVASASANDSGINASTCFSPASVAHAARDTTSITTLQRENKLLKEEVVRTCKLCVTSL